MVVNLNDPRTQRAWIVAQAKCHSCKFLCPQILIQPNAVAWQTLPCGRTHARLVVKEDESVECDSYEKSDKGPTMASEVMMFDSIVAKVRHEIDDNECGYLKLMGDRVKEVLDELEAAHKREVDNLDNVFHARHLNQMLHTSQSALEVEIVRNKKLEECLSRAINIICDKCDDMVRVKCICGEKKDCEVMRFRKALEENGYGRH